MFNIAIIGNLTRDVELRTVNTASGQKKVADLNIAVNGRKVGDREAPVAYIKATAWEGLAEVAAKYCKKGQKVSITSNFMTARAYTNKNGEPAASMECRIVEFELLGGAHGGASSDNSAAPVQHPAATDAQSGFELAEDTANLPF